MAERDDITIVQDVSPRYSEVASPSTTVSMQDYVDTLRVLESEFVNMSYPIMLNASGKDDLGGGLFVGITASQQNLRLAFEARRTPAATGSATSASGAPDQRDRQRLIDTNADFVSANVAPGSFVVNWTDRSVTDVVRVISATELEVKGLVNGTDNDFDIADDYAVWNIVQCRADGGNLVAVDDIGASISAIQPSAFTQVILTLSSSATISEIENVLTVPTFIALKDL